FRQLAEASGGVPRLLATLLGAGAWLAESGGAGMITAAHIQEAAELRSVLSPVSTEVTATAPDDPAAPAMTATTTETVRRGWVMWSALVVGLGAGAILAPRLLPAETGWVTGQANGLVTRAEQWLGGVSGRAGVTAEVPAERVVPARVLPPIMPHVVPASEPAEVARDSTVAGGVAPVPASVQAPPLSVRTEPVLVPTLPSPTADPALLPVETRDFLVRRGHEMAAMDDISAARLLFRRAAEGGSAEAMYELGRTYDPAVRTGLGASQADKAEAMNWYRRAAAQGVSAAQAALSDN
ncbi:MAG: hypothetical protein M3N26_02200, partial [Pseudomonadota bacterium]|nr:hypothetical protein [Pseudomonadota bacterium]